MRSTCRPVIGGAILCLAACAANPDYGPNGTGVVPGSGGAGGNPGTAGASAYVPPVLKVQNPSPIISRGKQVFSSPANGSAVVDGNYHNGGWSIPNPTSAAPAWVAIKLGAGPTRILVSWDDGGTYNYKDLTTATVYGLPADYHFEVSADSTNGADGTWASAGSAVTGNQVRTRAQSFDFTGMSWVKMVITAKPANESGNGVQIGEIDVHDVSSTPTGIPDDTWFFMGDSITAFAYDRATPHQPSFAKLVGDAFPTFLPAMINGGIGGEKTTDALARLPEALSLNPDYRFFVLGYGTNDAANGQIPTGTFQTNLQKMIDMIKAAGHEPIIPHIPDAGDGSHGSIPAYDTIIDTLTRTNHLQVGPDLYGYFMQHTDQFICPPCNGRSTDNLHPNDDGLTAMSLLWANAVHAFYQ